VSYHLSIKERDGYLHLTVTGENQPETVKNYLAAIHQECLQRGVSAILIEENLRGPSLKFMEIFRIASEGSEQASSQIRRLAYVDSNLEHSYANMKFAETVAANRGLNVRVFPTVEDAVAWLNSLS
jgi:hypothetical protein